MKFYSVRDLRTESKRMWDNLSSGTEIIITNNGKPAALMIDINEDNFEDTLRAIRQAKAMLAFNSMRSTACSHGYMSEEDIEAEIKASRVAEDIAYECCD